MDLFSFNTIILILFYVPGYIFIHTVDYFLLKREKTQFEITIQGLLASVCLLIQETIYLNSVPGMTESLIKGKNTPLADCLSEDEVE